MKMSFSEFLASRRAAAKALVQELRRDYSYASVLGEDIKETGIHADRNTSGIRSGGYTGCGFVVKVSKGSVFFEYSLDDIDGDISLLAEKIRRGFTLAASVQNRTIDPVALPDEPLVQSFCRPTDLADYTDAQILDFCKTNCAKLLESNEKLLNAVVSVNALEISKLFISEHRQLDQY